MDSQSTPYRDPAESRLQRLESRIDVLELELERAHKMLLWHRIARNLRRGRPIFTSAKFYWIAALLTVCGFLGGFLTGSVAPGRAQALSTRHIWALPTMRYPSIQRVDHAHN